MREKVFVIDSYLGLSTLLSRSLSKTLATQVIQAAMPFAEHNADPRRVAGILGNCAVYFCHLGDIEQAEALLRMAFEALDMADDRSDLAGSISYNLGFIADVRGDFDLARRHWEQALEASVLGKVLPVTLEASAGLGRLALKKGKMKIARAYAAQALRLVRKGGFFVDDRVGVEELLARIRYDSGLHHKALDRLDGVAQTAFRSDIPLYLNAQILRIELLVKEKRTSEAKQVAAKLKEVAEELQVNWWSSEAERLLEQA